MTDPPMAGQTLGRWRHLELFPVAAFDRHHLTVGKGSRFTGHGGNGLGTSKAGVNVAVAQVIR